MDEKLTGILTRFKENGKKITILTGAGISAESGIPTFRGKEGYWTVGSKEYHPQEMATRKMFQKNPYQVWLWYLYRKTICNKAQPNSGHKALVELEKYFHDDFCLITQNVDNLHIRAGNSDKRTFLIHGNIDMMRCAKECTTELYPIPDNITPKDKNSSISEKDKELLVCPKCGEMSRPHILWFDECYNEEFFRFESSLRISMETDLLMVVGTSGVTNLPMQVGMVVANRGAAMLDINPQSNPFSQMAQSLGNGYFCQGSGGEYLPKLAEFLCNK